VKPRRFRAPATTQHGMVLVIALIVLVIMTMGTLAMVRSIDTGNLVAGNLSFKQGATAAGDIGTEAAIAWLQARIGTAELYQDSPENGYYATSMDLLDVSGGKNDPALARVDWDFNDCQGAQAANCVTPSPALDAGNGNTVSTMIHRLCAQPLDPNSSLNSCVNALQSGDASAKRGELKYGDDKRFGGQPAEYYRITTRVKGPKNTVSLIETVVNF
jgi:type IV pilus assembly protein PilX